MNIVEINNIRYFDDTISVAVNTKDLQLLLNKVSKCNQEMGVNINNEKTNDNLQRGSYI